MKIVPHFLSLALAISFASASETLYNGITLPDIWPPRAPAMKAGEPVPVPYLEHPPAVISVDVGRQLFVDDFLI